MAAAAAASSRLSRTAVTTDSKKLVAGSKLRRLEARGARDEALRGALLAGDDGAETVQEERVGEEAAALDVVDGWGSGGGRGRGRGGSGWCLGGRGEPAVSDARSAPRRRRRDARVRAEPPFASGRAARVREEAVKKAQRAVRARGVRGVSRGDQRPKNRNVERGGGPTRRVVRAGDGRDGCERRERGDEEDLCTERRHVDWR